MNHHIQYVIHTIAYVQNEAKLRFKKKNGTNHVFAIKPLQSLHTKYTDTNCLKTKGTKNNVTNQIKSYEKLLHYIIYNCIYKKETQVK